MAVEAAFGRTADVVAEMRGLGVRKVVDARAETEDVFGVRVADFVLRDCGVAVGASCFWAAAESLPEPDKGERINEVSSCQEPLG